VIFRVRPRRTQPAKAWLRSAGVRRIDTFIDIVAPRERIWAILTDFAAFPDWNPFIRSATGEVRKGARLEVVLGAPGSKPITFKPVVIEAEASRSFAWLGRLGVRGLFDGEHHFELEELGDGVTRFRHYETFGGVLVPLTGKTLATAETGFVAMNDALKARAEAPHLDTVA
jgi:hypothetical protein